MGYTHVLQIDADGQLDGREGHARERVAVEQDGRAQKCRGRQEDAVV